MSRAISFAALALIGAAACGGDTTTTTDMGMTAHDMTTTQTMDMTVVPPTFDVPTGCTPNTTTTLASSSLYTNIISPKCATTNCHVTGATPPNYSGGAATFSANVKNVSAGRPQNPTMQYIKPNDLNNSFILYKVTGQQGKVQFGGAQMPQNGPPYLSPTDQCTLISWVNSGAN